MAYKYRVHTDLENMEVKLKNKHLQVFENSAFSPQRSNVAVAIQDKFYIRKTKNNILKNRIFFICISKILGLHKNP